MPRKALKQRAAFAELRDQEEAGAIHVALRKSHDISMVQLFQQLNLRLHQALIHLRLDAHSLHGALLPGELLRHHADLSEAALPELLVVHDVVLQDVAALLHGTHHGGRQLHRLAVARPRRAGGEGHLLRQGVALGGHLLDDFLLMTIADRLAHRWPCRLLGRRGLVAWCFRLLRRLAFLLMMAHELLRRIFHGSQGHPAATLGSIALVDSVKPRGIRLRHHRLQGCKDPPQGLCKTAAVQATRAALIFPHEAFLAQHFNGHSHGKCIETTQTHG
mmetsp:Transcript_75997/g.167746  ORF Transcript_75997/g.167746 Transcript_75997/m.167746 type:complete len:275 (-) Transcript_75997:8-832(-)